MSTRIDIDSVRNAAIAALADAEGLPIGDVEGAVTAIGDAAFELDSKKAEVMIAAMEEAFACTLPGPADLRRDQFATFGALVELVTNALNREPAWAHS